MALSLARSSAVWPLTAWKMINAGLEEGRG